MRDCQLRSAKSLWLFFSFLGFLVVFAGCNSVIQPQPDAQQPVPQKIIGIDAISNDDSEEIIIQANARLEEYSRVKQKTPRGLLFLFPETELGDIPAEITPKSSLINSIAATTTEDKKNVRVEIGLNRDMDYGVLKTDSSLRIIFDKTPVSAENSNDQPQSPAGNFMQPAGLVEQDDSSSKAVKSSGKSAVIQQIDFSAKRSGESAVIIGTSKPISHEIRRLSDRRLQLRLFHARLPEHRKHRPLITTRFDSAVDRVSPVQTRGTEDSVDIIVELRQSVPFRTEKNEGQLILHFEPSSIGPRPMSAANLPPWKKVLEESSEGIVSEAQTPVAREATLDQINNDLQKAEGYTGQKIALNFYDTNIKNVFRIMQQISGKNYAIDPDVNGKVTISMEKPVPWDQVLDLILQQNKLGMEEKGDIIRIAKLQTLAQEEQARQQKVQAYKKRMEQEKTLEPLITEYVSVSYANAQNEILPHVESVLTEGRGKISVDQRNNQLIITDVLDVVEKAKEIISRIDKVTPQVVIEARIVEVSDDFSREIGTEWSVASEDYNSDLGGNFGYDMAMNHPAASTSSIGFDFVRLPSMGTPLVLNARLTAMEENGEGKIISSPKIVTLDNKKAIIKQGFEYPYQTVEDDNVEINFKEIDLRLEVTPHVTPDKRIALQIFVTKNDIDQILAGGEPALSTNEAQTELLVDDGDTIVIGGVMKKSFNKSETGFPILKDIPLIGWLFKSQSNSTEKNEILIFMTPRIVQLEQRGLASK